MTLSTDDFKSVMEKFGVSRDSAKRSQRNFLALAFGYLAVSACFVAVIVGLVSWRLEASKEIKFSGGALVGQNGNVAHIGAVETLAEIYALPRYSVTTLYVFSLF